MPCVLLLEKLISNTILRVSRTDCLRPRYLLETKFVTRMHSCSSNSVNNERLIDFQFALYPDMMSCVLSIKWRKKETGYFRIVTTQHPK